MLYTVQADRAVYAQAPRTKTSPVEYYKHENEYGR